MNLILDAIPKSELQQLAPHLKPVELAVGDVLFDEGSEIDRFFFIDDGVVSLLGVMENGTTAEITVVGKEGFVNVGSLLDDDMAIARHVVQTAVRARTISARVLRDLLEKLPKLNSAAYRYIQALIGQISQSVACNTVHVVHRRMARWLLMMHDRTTGDEIHIGQDLIAGMLGVRRATVSVTARSLQDAGLISYSRGRVRIEDRAGLEKASCECYRVINGLYRRLLPEVGDPSKPSKP